MRAYRWCFAMPTPKTGRSIVLSTGLKGERLSNIRGLGSTKIPDRVSQELHTNRIEFGAAHLRRPSKTLK